MVSLNEDLMVLVIEDVDPRDLMNLACSSKQMYKLCRKRILEHRLWDSRYRHLSCCTDLRWHINSKDRTENWNARRDFAQIAKEIGSNPFMAYHIRSFELCTFPTHSHDALPRELQAELNNDEDSRLHSLIRHSPFLHRDQVRHCLQDIETDSEVAPVVAAVIAQASRLSTLSITLSHLENKYYGMMLAWKSSQTPNALSKIRRLEFKSFPGSGDAIDVWHIIQFPRLESLRLLYCSLENERLQSSDESSVSARYRRSLSRLEDLTIESGSATQDGLSFLANRCTTLRSFRITEWADPALTEESGDGTLLPMLSRTLCAPNLQRTLSLINLNIDVPLDGLDLRALNNLEELTLWLHMSTAEEAQPLCTFLPPSICYLKICESRLTDCSPEVFDQLFYEFDLDSFPALKCIDLDLDLRDDTSLSEHERLMANFECLKRATLSVGAKVYRFGSRGQSVREIGARKIVDLMTLEEPKTMGRRTWLLWDDMIWTLVGNGQEAHPELNNGPELVEVGQRNIMRLAVR
ncbi:MAG: hypothetical protein Q9227_006978 [Pyrenula ochraceoflavens]